MNDGAYLEATRVAAARGKSKLLHFPKRFGILVNNKDASRISYLESRASDMSPEARYSLDLFEALLYFAESKDRNQRAHKRNL